MIRGLPIMAGKTQCLALRQAAIEAAARESELQAEQAAAEREAAPGTATPGRIKSETPLRAKSESALGSKLAGASLVAPIAVVSCAKVMVSGVRFSVFSVFSVLCGHRLEYRSVCEAVQLIYCSLTAHSGDCYYCSRYYSVLRSF